MRGSRAARWLIAVPALCLAGLLAAEALNLLRTDTVAAAGCARALFSEPPDGAEIVARLRGDIVEQSARYDLPPEAVAAVIHGHQESLTPFRAFTDCAGSAYGADLSLGPAQIRISTAMEGDRIDPRSAPPRVFKAYRARLLDPAENVALQAREMRRILDRDVRYPGIASQEIIHDPSVMALLMSEYRAGRQAASNADARIGASGLRDLGHLLESSVHVFGREAEDVAAIQRGVADYLDAMYCSGKERFNPVLCERWRASPARGQRADSAL